MRAAFWLFAMAFVALIATERSAKAGPSYSLGRKAVCAEVILELDLAFAHSPASDALVERAAATHHAFPDQVRARALARARIANVLYGAQAMVLPKPIDVYVPERVWRAAYRRGHLRALIFLRRINDRPVSLFGVEGAPTNVDPSYPKIREAVARYARWRDHQAEAAVAVEAEKILTTTPNADEATLASSFLCSIGRADAVARAGRKAPPAVAACPPQPVSCDDW